MRAWDGVSTPRTLVALVVAASVCGLAVAAVAAVAIGRRARLSPADFTFVNGGDITSLDPPTISGIPEGRVIRAVFEGLCSKDPRTLAPVPGMAESWEVSPDGREYVFHIRRNARWSNGDPVTAGDFVAGFQRLLDPLTAAEYAYQLWYVRGARAYTCDTDPRGAARHPFDSVAIRARDAHTLEIGLEHPVPYFLDLVAYYPLFPTNPRSRADLSARFPDTWQLEWMRPEHIVCNGPFKPVLRRVNDRIRLVKNPDYWDADNVAFETIDVLAVEHTGTMLNLYLTGAVGWVEQAPANLVQRLVQREDFANAAYLGTYFYRVNVTRPPFDDRRVRRALALAIDREAITERVTKAGELPSWSIVPPGIAGWSGAQMPHARSGDSGGDSGGASAAGSGDDLGADFARDVAEARALFAAAGFGPAGRPFPTIEIHFNTRESHKDIAEVIADSWRVHLGIHAKLQNQEWKVFMDTQASIDFDVSRSSWIADYPDPYTFLDIFQTGNENNRTGWGDARYDALIARAATLQGAERTRVLAEAEALVLAELPVLPIYSYVTRNLVAPRLGGFHANVLDEHFPKYWYWMDDAELAEKRAAQDPGRERVAAHGPSAGLYPPSHPKHRPRRSP